MISEVELVVRLLASAVAGGIIGMEREAKNRPAGLKTHILVTLGSALIMLISMYGFTGMGNDGEGGEPARLAAQVVSGIGFLGAGTILRNGNSVYGLTTAASIWVCGGIGLAIGNGYYLGGAAATFIVMMTLRSMDLLEKRVYKSSYKSLVVYCTKRVGLIGDVGMTLGRNNISVKDIKVKSDNESEDEGKGTIFFKIKLPSNLIMERLFDELMGVEGVESAGWEEDYMEMELS